MLNILVIGSNDFVGRVFVEKLVARRAYRVFVMNRQGFPLQIPGISEICCDCRLSDIVDKSLPPLPWHAVVDFCSESPSEIAAVLSASSAHGLGHYLFVSSASVYAPTRNLLVTEEYKTLTDLIPDPDPDRECARKKRAAERKLEHLCRELKVPFTILRPTHIYGRYNDAPDVSSFFDRVSFGRQIVSPRNSRTLFSCVVVDDVARACIVCMGNIRAYGRIFNLAGNEIISYQRLIEVFEIITGEMVRSVTLTAEDIDAQGISLPFPLKEHMVYSGALITQVLGFVYTPFLEGMRSTYRWYRNYKEKTYDGQFKRGHRLPDPEPRACHVPKRVNPAEGCLSGPA